MRRLHADLILLFAAAVWGLAFVFQKTAMSHIGPLLFIGARAGVAALALAPVALVEHRRSGSPVPWRELVPVSALGGLAFFLGAALQQAGLVTASVTNTGFLTALYVIVTPFAAWLWHRKPPSTLIWPAVALSFAGTWALGGGSVEGFGIGDALVAFSAIFWSAHVVIVGASGRHARPVAFTALQFVVVAALGLAGAALFEQVTLAGIRAAAVEIAYVGLLSSALTFTLLAVALRHTPPSEAAVLVSTETLFAALAGALLLGDRLSPLGWIGAGLIFAAILLVQLGPGFQRSRAAER